MLSSPARFSLGSSLIEESRKSQRPFFAVQNPERGSNLRIASFEMISDERRYFSSAPSSASWIAFFVKNVTNKRKSSLKGAPGAYSRPMRSTLTAACT